MGDGFPFGGFAGGCDCLTGGVRSGLSTAVRGTPGERPRPAGSGVRAGRNEPPLAEITSGKALNQLLDEVRDLHARGFRGPEVGLDEDVVRAIQVGSGRGRDRLAVLKDRGRLEWPTARSASEFETEWVLLGALTSEAIRQAVGGRVDARTLKEMKAVVGQLRRRLAGSSSAIPKEQYGEAADFVAQLEGALQVLRQPEAGNAFKQSFAADAKTVSALVQEMTQQGQRFAPAAAGGATAYRALRRALAAYEEGARARSSAKGQGPGGSAPAVPNGNQGRTAGGYQTASGYPGQGTGLGGSCPGGRGPQDPACRKKTLLRALDKERDLLEAMWYELRGWDKQAQENFKTWKVSGRTSPRMGMRALPRPVPLDSGARPRPNHKRARGPGWKGRRAARPLSGRDTGASGQAPPPLAAGYPAGARRRTTIPCPAGRPWPREQSARVEGGTFGQGLPMGPFPRTVTMRQCCPCTGHVAGRTPWPGRSGPPRPRSRSAPALAADPGRGEPSFLARTQSQVQARSASER
jgi:hypothetical protein